MRVLVTVMVVLAALYRPSFGQTIDRRLAPQSPARRQTLLGPIVPDLTTPLFPREAGGRETRHNRVPGDLNIPDSLLTSATFSLLPNMIGDSTFGGCGGLSFDGALAVSVAHPTYACSRINIAENNSPLVRNRFYVTYRHFHNSTPLAFFPRSPQGLTTELNIDRVTFAGEWAITPRCSVEVRVPINRQWGSSQRFLANDTPFGGPFDRSNNNLDEVLNDRDGELGNLAIILKRRLYQTDRCYVSLGLGINLPTAPDVQISGLLDDANFSRFNPDGSLLFQLPPPGVRIEFDGFYKNQTVGLQPFLAALCTPTSQTWMQGFLQFDVPVNESDGDLSLAGNVLGIPIPAGPGVGKLGLQTLMRVNLGAGVWLYENRNARYLKAVGAQIEGHYTTTLQDADLNEVSRPIPPVPGLASSLDLAFGNAANRVDSVNMTIGIPVQIAKTTIYNGFVVPLRDAFDRGFDFEYMLGFDRQF